MFWDGGAVRKHLIKNGWWYLITQPWRGATTSLFMVASRWGCYVLLHHREPGQIFLRIKMLVDQLTLAHIRHACTSTYYSRGLQRE